MRSAVLNITSVCMFILFFFFVFFLFFVFFFFVYFTISDSCSLHFPATYFSYGSVVVVLTGLTFYSYHDIANALHFFFFFCFFFLFLFLFYFCLFFYNSGIIAFHDIFFCFTSHHVNFIVNIPLAMNFLLPILND